MAKKGYLFEKVTLPGVYHFKKSEPTNMIYRIDFNPQKKENRESYLQMFKDYGWEYIQDLNEFSTSVNWMTEQMMIFLMTMNQELKCWKE